MSATLCSICSNKINNQRKALKCVEKACTKLCHQECIPVDQESENWRCKDCVEPSLMDLMREIKKISNMNKDLGKSLDSCHEKINEMHTYIKNQDVRINECSTKMEELSEKFEVLKKENVDLKNKLNTQEQYSRLSSVEIYGIPEIKEENILSTIGYVFRSLHVKMSEDNIDSCYRLNKQSTSKEPRGIFLKFTSRWKKEEFMRAKRVRNTLNLSDINKEWIGCAQEAKTPIYINESLTDTNRILFSKCREFKKKQSIKYLWIKNGKILMRKAESTKVYVINSIGDLNDVH